VELANLKMEVAHTIQVVWKSWVVQIPGVKVDQEKMDGPEIKMVEPGKHLVAQRVVGVGDIVEIPPYLLWTPGL
jgi:hypothetical protein